MRSHFWAIFFSYIELTMKNLDNLYVEQIVSIILQENNLPKKFIFISYNWNGISFLLLCFFIQFMILDLFIRIKPCKPKFSNQKVSLEVLLVSTLLLYCSWWKDHICLSCYIPWAVLEFELRTPAYYQGTPRSLQAFGRLQWKWHLKLKILGCVTDLKPIYPQTS